MLLLPAGLLALAALCLLRVPGARAAACEPVRIPLCKSLPWNMTKMPEGDPIPEGMDYDTWHGGIRYHNFSNLYHQGDWCSWYDFGMGALGDWGAHLLYKLIVLMHFVLKFVFYFKFV